MHFLNIYIFNNSNILKSFYFVVSFFLSVFFLSCSSEDPNDNTTVENGIVNTLIDEINSLDKRIILQLTDYKTRGGNCTCSNCSGHCNSTCKGQCNVNQQQSSVDTVGVALKDAAGFLYGAAAGAQLGGSAGTVTLPIIGTIAGGSFWGFIGGLIGAVAASWDAWHYETDSNYALNTTDTLAVLHYDNVIGSVNKTLYIDTVFTSNYINQNQLQLLDPSTYLNTFLLYKVASLHNSSIQVLSDTAVSHRPYKYLGNPPVLTIDTLNLLYNNFMNSDSIHYYLTEPGTQSNDNVHVEFYRFSDMMRRYGTTKNNVEIIVTNYLEQVYDSNYLSNSEKLKLHVTMYLTWHSYKYWTKKKMLNH